MGRKKPTTILTASGALIDDNTVRTGIAAKSTKHGPSSATVSENKILKIS